MFNYIKADFYRIFAKNGLYTYFVFVIGMMILGLFTLSSTIAAHNLNMTAMADFVFMLFGILASSYLFSTIYNDDLTAKTLPPVIGFGKKRWTIIISKLIMNIILTIIVFFLAVVALYVTLTIMGFQFNSDHIHVISQAAIKNILKGIAIGSVASVLTYGLQKTTPAIIIFIMISTSFVQSIISLVLNKLKMDQLNNYLIDSILLKLMNEVTITTIVPYVLYIMFFTILAIVAFKQKDLDF